MVSTRDGKKSSKVLLRSSHSASDEAPVCKRTRSSASFALETNKREKKKDSSTFVKQEEGYTSLLNSTNFCKDKSHALNQDDVKKEENSCGNIEDEVGLSVLPSGRDELQSFYNFCVNDCRGYRGKVLSEAFKSLPTRAEYPLYYDVIEKPMDLKKIESKLRRSAYSTLEELYADLCLMLSNAAAFNEPRSSLYREASLLKKLLASEYEKRTSAKNPESSVSRFTLGPNSEMVSEVGAHDSEENHKLLQPRLRTIFIHVSTFNFQNKTLSDTFWYLPNWKKYPNYYTTIKCPMDLCSVDERLQACHYTGMSHFISDLTLTFYNAIQYNESDSQIVRDAFLLLTLTLYENSEALLSLHQQRTSREGESKSVSPHVAMAHAFTKLFVGTLLHRNSSSSPIIFLDILITPAFSDVSFQIDEPVNFCVVAKRIEHFAYRSLRHFQCDFLAALKNIRINNLSDIKIFNATYDLQKTFLQLRDAFFSNETHLRLDSIAFDFSLKKPSCENISLRVKKTEHLPDVFNDNVFLNLSEDMNSLTVRDQETGSQAIYQTDTFVYLRNFENDKKCNDTPYPPHILYIHSFAKKCGSVEEGGEDVEVIGTWLFHPHETFHSVYEKFYPKEVLYVDGEGRASARHILGKCCVLHADVYFKYMSREFNDADTYVCESRYSKRLRLIKKIQRKPNFLATPHDLLLRETPLVRTKSPCTFFVNATPGEYEKMGIFLREKYEDVEIAEVAPTRVLAEDTESKEVCFAQYSSKEGVCFKLNDCLVISSNAGERIIRVSKIWRPIIFHESAFVRVSATTFVKSCQSSRELIFLQNSEETFINPSILKKCYVLSKDNFKKMRPLDCNDGDVYFCEKQLKPSINDKEAYGGETLQCVLAEEGEVLKNLKQHPNAYKEEWLHADFDTDFYGCHLNALSKSFPKIDVLEASFQDDTTHRESVEMALKPTLPFTLQDSLCQTRKFASGYIYYAKKIRKHFMAKYPDWSFGQISRIVGEHWKGLSDKDKQMFRQKAMLELATKMKKSKEACEQEVMSVPPGFCIFYICGWRDCFQKFRYFIELSKHIHSHLKSSGPFFCHWRNCQRASNRQFKNRTSLKYHIIRNHLVSCKVVSQVGSNLDELATSSGREEALAISGAQSQAPLSRDHALYSSNGPNFTAFKGQRSPPPFSQPRSGNHNDLICHRNLYSSPSHIPSYFSPAPAPNPPYFYSSHHQHYGPQLSLQMHPLQQIGHNMQPPPLQPILTTPPQNSSPEKLFYSVPKKRNVNLAISQMYLRYIKSLFPFNKDFSQPPAHQLPEFLYPNRVSTKEYFVNSSPNPNPQTLEALNALKQQMLVDSLMLDSLGCNSR